MDSNNNRINEGTYTEVKNLFGNDLNKKSFYTDEFLDGNNVDSNDQGNSPNQMSTKEYFQKSGGLKWKKNEDLYRPQGIRHRTKTCFKKRHIKNCLKQN